MQSKKTIFEQSYENYLQQLSKLSFESIAEKIGAEKYKKNILKISLYKNDYEISAEKIVDSSGKKPTYDICVILSKYLLMSPDKPPENKNWVLFRNFKDSGPLINYFTNNIENKIASHFSSKITDLKKVSNILGGYPPALEADYDYAVQFDALPMIPIVLLYNDQDEEFSAKCSLLFENRAEEYLDAECISMIGWQLYSNLKKNLNKIYGVKSY